MILFEKKRSTTPPVKTEESRFEQIRKTAVEQRNNKRTGAPLRDQPDDDGNSE